MLLQRRPPDKENGGCWDKTVGGHVDAGEDFDQAAVRETGEELFDDGSLPARATRGARGASRPALGRADLGRQVVFRREALQLNLRDVRRAPDGTLRNVLYHVASYLGRTEVPLEGFRPQADEIAGLRYASGRRGRPAAARRRAVPEHGVPVADPRARRCSRCRASPRRR